MTAAAATIDLNRRLAHPLAPPAIRGDLWALRDSCESLLTTPETSLLPSREGSGFAPSRGGSSEELLSRASSDQALLPPGPLSPDTAAAREEAGDRCWPLLPILPISRLVSTEALETSMREASLKEGSLREASMGEASLTQGTPRDASMKGGSPEGNRGPEAAQVTAGASTPRRHRVAAAQCPLDRRPHPTPPHQALDEMSLSLSVSVSAKSNASAPPVTHKPSWTLEKLGLEPCALKPDAARKCNGHVTVM